MARSLTTRTSPPTVQNDRAPAVTGAASQTVELTARGSIPRRDSPTELFATCLALAQFGSARSHKTVDDKAAAAHLETIDYGALKLSQDGRMGVFNGFWWASSATNAGQFWTSEFPPPTGYRVVATDTVMIPRQLLLASQQVQRIGRTSVVLSLFSLAGAGIDSRGRPFAQASYLRATTPGMAVRLWQTNDHGLAVLNQSVVLALAVPRHWVRGVLDSPPILGQVSHDLTTRIR